MHNKKVLVFCNLAGIMNITNNLQACSKDQDWVLQNYHKIFYKSHLKIVIRYN